VRGVNLDTKSARITCSSGNVKKQTVPGYCIRALYYEDDGFFAPWSRSIPLVQPLIHPVDRDNPAIFHPYFGRLLLCKTGYGQGGNKPAGPALLIFNSIAYCLVYLKIAHDPSFGCRSYLFVQAVVNRIRVV
jgi:hypothetical protein